MSYIFWMQLFQRLILVINKHFLSILRGIRILLTHCDRIEHKIWHHVVSFLKRYWVFELACFIATPSPYGKCLIFFPNSLFLCCARFWRDFYWEQDYLLLEAWLLLMLHRLYFARRLFTLIPFFYSMKCILIYYNMIMIQNNTYAF